MSIHIIIFSDDRSQEVFQRSIEAATQMQALSLVDNRPNCLIIDEIDGAPTVSPLLQFVRVSLTPQTINTCMYKHSIMKRFDTLFCSCISVI